MNERKPRTDSELQTQIPEDQQRAIILLLRSNSYKKVVELVQAEPFSLDTSVGALQRFYHWWHARRQLEQVAERAQDFERSLKAVNEAQKLGVQSEAISMAGQLYFESEAMRLEDPKLFVALRGRRQIDRDLDLREREVKLKEEAFAVRTCELFLKWFADQAARSIAESSATNADKIARLRERYFKDVEDLEKSGELVLPT